MAELEIYWSFRSPYSYLATPRLSEMARNYAVDIDFRPVRPLAMRESDFFERARPQFLPYMLQDMVREAERLGVPFALPNPDPIDMDLSTGKVAPDQPIMDVVMRLGIAAAALGSGLDFAAAIAPTVWGGKADWHKPDELRASTEAAGIDFDALQNWTKANEEQFAEILARNEADQLKHHWGVPLMVLDGEPFFGQDRLETLEWRMRKLGLGRS